MYKIFFDKNNRVTKKSIFLLICLFILSILSIIGTLGIFTSSLEQLYSKKRFVSELSKCDTVILTTKLISDTLTYNLQEERINLLKKIRGIGAYRDQIGRASCRERV